MKRSGDIGAASSSRAASHSPLQPTQPEGVAPPREEHADFMPTGPLLGLPSSSAALRSRRTSLSGRAKPHADYTEEVMSQVQEINEPAGPAAAATYAERSTAEAAKVKAQLRARLDALPFAAPSKEQTALQAAYLQWADARVQERITAFGPDAGYQAVGDMKTAGIKAALPIAYQCLRSFILGAMRNPVGLATGAAYAARRPVDAEELSTVMVSGIAAGSASYTSDTLLIPAMDRRTRVANMPKFQAVDPKILEPDPPPVILEVTAEGKRFTRLGDDDAPTLAELKAQTYDRRLVITQRQSNLDDKSLNTLLLKPVINAIFNAARRTGGNPDLLTPAGQLGLSALAIGGAGVVQKALLETGKAVPRTGQTSVPDLVGGEQRLNLFALALPDKERRPAQWSDAVHFPPKYLLDTGKEALALARQGVNSANAIATTVRDLLTRHMLSNVISSFASIGAARIIAAPLRGGATDLLLAKPPIPRLWSRSRPCKPCSTIRYGMRSRPRMAPIPPRRRAWTTKVPRLQPSINVPSNKQSRPWPSPWTRRSPGFRIRHVPWRRGCASRLALGCVAMHCVPPCRHCLKRSARSPSRSRPSMRYVLHCARRGQTSRAVPRRGHAGTGWSAANAQACTA